MGQNSQPDTTPSDTTPPENTPPDPGDNSLAAEKVRSFPHAPGVYIMKDAASRVIYVGKAKDLRSRAGSYFLKAAAQEQRTALLVKDIRDIEYIQTESEIDALLLEARLIKDILPKYNKDLRDSKTFPYLEVTTREEFPRIYVTREPRTRGTKLYGPFPSSGDLHAAISVLQKIFKFRTCALDIHEADDRWQWYRPCLLASINQCTAPCNRRIGKDDYRKAIRRLQRFLDGNKKMLIGEMRRDMAQAAKDLCYEEAAELRDEIELLESLDRRGDLDIHVQPEAFHVDPQKGLVGLQKVLNLKNRPRTIEGVDIAHLGGLDTVASVVKFIDGYPFKPGYRRFKIRMSEGVDDYGSIHEVVARRFHRLDAEEETFPDILLIDGGRGQLNAALSAFKSLQIEPPIVLSLAKREEEIYSPQSNKPLRLSRHSYALRLLQYVRDEAHRFAQHYHHILRKKSTLGD
ncbi:MAG: excinuclease ABC subunit UvrC [Planctomycetota bacterium]|nr:excinuclease ABC subunit UvrC [Planctomycetota bacterium]